MEITLDKGQVGNSYLVSKIREGSKVRRRIMDLGIVKGTKIKVEGMAPFGDPIEISLRGYKLTLRKEEAKDIIVG
ncbi:ferrous iron transport protein A [Hathewaya histolytica]|uniref:Ferrous iron transport protein A n=1 Tax=Hathewaya histolytica TaxID=1498 RepID=A0A4U9R526_HATHI|nr:ferrous iron transport protein A [Hathewaya histolytica]VTQ86425.1 ferrous iron transport protein A [Hathewaya histolytica]